MTENVTHHDETYRFPGATPVPPINVGNPAAITIVTDATDPAPITVHPCSCAVLYPGALTHPSPDEWRAGCLAHPVTQDRVLHLIENVITAAGQHRSAAVRTAQARRSLTTSELEAALAAEESAHTAERDAVRALRDAITKAIPA